MIYILLILSYQPFILFFYKKLLLIPLSNEDKRINQVYPKYLNSIACAPSPHQHHAFPPHTKTSVGCTL